MHGDVTAYIYKHGQLYKCIKECWSVPYNIISNRQKFTFYTINSCSAHVSIGIAYFLFYLKFLMEQAINFEINENMQSHPNTKQKERERERAKKKNVIHKPNHTWMQ